MARRDIEIGLEITDDGKDRPFRERIARAASAAGGELVCVVPAPDKREAIVEHALVRLRKEGGDQMMAVHDGPDGLLVLDEAEIDEALLAFARASVEVLDQLRADKGVKARVREAEPV